MVWKEIVICDLCGKEMKFLTRGYCTDVSITMHKNTAEALGLKWIAHPRRRRLRRSILTVTVDICSKKCMTELLEKIKVETPPKKGYI